MFALRSLCILQGVIFFVSLQAFAETPAPGDATKPDNSESREPTVGTGSPVPAPADNIVEPLEAWESADPQTPTPEKTESEINPVIDSGEQDVKIETFGESYKIFGTGEAEEEDDHVLVVRKRKPKDWTKVREIIFSDFEQRRMSRLKRVLKKYEREDKKLAQFRRKRIRALQGLVRATLSREQEVLQEYYEQDSRGEPEVRLCSLNLNNFGAKTEVGRLFRKKGLRRFPKKEKSIVEAIVNTRCDVVALQQLVGTTFLRAQEGISALASKLSDAGGEPWQGYVEVSNHKLAYNAFVVRKNGVSVLGVQSHKDKILPQAGKLREDHFTRTPLTMKIKVSAKKHGVPGKVITLVNYHLQKSLVALNPDPEGLRIQMAEAIRQLLLYEVRTFDPETPGIVVALGDRMATRSAPSTRVLEGSVRLAEFKKSVGNCALDEDEQIVCKKKPEYPKVLFGLLGEGFVPSKIIEKRITADGRAEKQYVTNTHAMEERQRRSRLTPEIYMLQVDLPNAWKKHNTPHQFALGEVDVETGLKQSPLLWVDLNW